MSGHLRHGGYIRAGVQQVTHKSSPQIVGAEGCHTSQNRTLCQQVIDRTLLLVLNYVMG
jgi:hypothetical protein